MKKSNLNIRKVFDIFIESFTNVGRVASKMSFQFSTKIIKRNVLK